MTFSSENDLYIRVKGKKIHFKTMVSLAADIDEINEFLENNDGYQYFKFGRPRYEDSSLQFRLTWPFIYRKYQVYFYPSKQGSIESPNRLFKFIVSRFLNHKLFINYDTYKEVTKKSPDTDTGILVFNKNLRTLYLIPLFKDLGT